VDYGPLKYYRIPVTSLMQLDGISPITIITYDCDIDRGEITTMFRLFTTKTIRADGLEEYDFPAGQWKLV
jgi:hypothetical protein